MIYSPSQSDTWLRCPVLRHMTREWEPRRVRKNNLAALLGSAVGDGINRYNQYLRDSETPNVTECIEVGLQRIATEQAKWAIQGRVIDIEDQPYLAGMEPKVGKLLREYDQNGLPKHWKVLDIEHTLPQHGNARIDLGVDDGFGPAVLDFKVKAYLKVGDEWRDINRWRNSWAMYHYTWAYGQVHNTSIDRYYIFMLVAEPKVRTKLYPFTVTPEAMAMWHVSAERVWTQMESEDNGTAEPWMASRHGDEYGPCPMYNACFMYQFDEHLMLNEYTRKETSG